MESEKEAELIGQKADKESTVTPTTERDVVQNTKMSDDLGKMEEDEEIIQMLPNSMLRVPEFMEIIQDEIEYTAGERPQLSSIPDLGGLLENILHKIQEDFSRKTVFLEVTNLYEMLLTSRNNEKLLQEKLNRCEDEATKLSDRQRRDPRVLKALLLAESWRKGKAAEEQASIESQIAVNAIKSDMKNLESKVNALQLMNLKLQKQCEKAKSVEDYIRQLEESAMSKENKITTLLSEIQDLKLNSLKKDEMPANLKVLNLDENEEEFELLHAVEDKTPLSIMKKVRVNEAVHKIKELEKNLCVSKRLEQISLRNFRNISSAMKSLKLQVNRLEAAIQDSNKRNQRLQAILTQKDRKITILEQLVHQGKLNQESLKQMLTNMNHTNKQLNLQKRNLTVLQKKLVEHEATKRVLRDTREEVTLCNKYEGRLSQDLKLAKLKIQDARRHSATKQRELTNAKIKALENQQSLVEAINYNNSLMKRIEITNVMLLHFKKKFEVCSAHHSDIMQTVTHLESLARNHTAAVRIKDAKNDALVLSLTSLRDLLKESHANAHLLMQKNMISQDNNRHQMERNDILQQILKFTEAERESAVSQCVKVANTVVILQQHQILRLGKIAHLYKEVCELKDVINDHVKMLDIQKKETNALDALLNRVQRDEAAMKIKIKSLTSERDLFGSMVIQEKIHVGLLNKNIKILNSVVERGTNTYRQLKNDVYILKLEIKNLRNKLHAKENKVVLCSKFRQELVHALKELALERSKRAIIEDLKLIKINQFRTIMNRNPSDYEKILKIRKLQKLLIIKSKQISRSEKLICKRDIEIKTLMTRLNYKPGSELAAESRTIISHKNRQIKGLLSELKVLTCDLSKCNKKLDEALGELKVSWEEITKLKRQIAKMSTVMKPFDSSVQTATQDAFFWQNRFRPLSLIKAQCVVRLPPLVVNKQTAIEMATTSPQKALQPTDK